MKVRQKGKICNIWQIYLPPPLSAEVGGKNVRIFFLTFSNVRIFLLTFFNVNCVDWVSWEFFSTDFNFFQLFLLYCILYCLGIYKITFILHTSLFILHKLSKILFLWIKEYFWCFVRVGFVRTEYLGQDLFLLLHRNCLQKDHLTLDTQLPKK